MQTANDNLTPGFHVYTPEMGQARPAATAEVTLGHYGEHYYVDSPVALKTGRSVKFLGTYTADQLTTSRKVGWHQYRVTIAGMKAVKRQLSLAYQMLLD